MPHTFKEDLITFFRNLTPANPEHKRELKKAVDKLKDPRIHIENNERDKEQIALTFDRYFGGLFSPNVRPVLTKADKDRLREIEKNYYTDNRPRPSKRS